MKTRSAESFQAAAGVSVRLGEEILQELQHPLLQLDHAPAADFVSSLQNASLRSALSSVREMLTVPRSQLMSCHFKARYSLGRAAVVSATAKTSP